jgi:trehalose 6-phosphate phosphatase
LLAGASLFLDFDGTLVDIAARPDAVRVGPRLASVLGRLARQLDGRMALVSGRPAREVASLVGLGAPLVAGSHGMEFLHPDGTLESAPRPPVLDQLREDWRRFAAGLAGVLVEDKPLGTALHYRLRPDAAEACHRLAAEAAQEHGLHLQTGKMMVELRAAGGDKGSAIRTLMQRPAMQGTHPVFLGDDDTDEPGLVVAEGLGGAGILVGAPRPTAARYILADPAAVLDWLEQELTL